MGFTASKKKLNNIDIAIFLNNTKLSIVPSYKYLGVTLDPHLKFDIHIRVMKQTVSYKTYMLACIRGSMTEQIALQIYKSMVVPYFDYGDILFMCTNQDLLDDLQVAQNRCLKICLKVPMLTNTEYIHAKTKIPLLKDRRMYHLYMFMYPRSRDPSYCDNQNLNTRGFKGPVLKRLTPHGGAYFKSVEHFGAMTWNQLKPECRSLPSKLAFKHDRKEWLNNQIPIMLR